MTLRRVPAARSRHAPLRLSVDETQEDEEAPVRRGLIGPTTLTFQTKVIPTTTVVVVVTEKPGATLTSSSNTDSVTDSATTSSLSFSGSSVSAPSTTTTTVTPTSASSTAAVVSVSNTKAKTTSTPSASPFSPSGTAAPASESSTTSAKSRLSPAAIAVPVVIVILVLAFVNFLWIRKRFVRNRQRKRGLAPRAPDTFAPQFVDNSGSSFGPGAGSGTPQMAMAGSGIGAYGTGAALASPAATYNNAPLPASAGVPVPFALRPSSRPNSMSAGGPRSPAPPLSATASYPFVATAAGALGSAGGPGTGRPSIVRCTFIPSLPDELSIGTGESVRVLAEYDDGWALCANARGEQGMVPLECLDNGNGSGEDSAYLGAPEGGSVISSGSGMLQRRASSLRGGLGNKGKF